MSPEEKVVRQARNRKEYEIRKNKALAETNPEIIEKNKERVAEKHLKYRESHREELLEKSNKYYLDNRESVLERSKNYYEDNKKAISEKRSIRYAYRNNLWDNEQHWKEVLVNKNVKFVEKK